MKYHIEFESRARKEFLDLPSNIQERLSTGIDDLENNPRPPGAKKLIGQEGYRIRKGDYRILYTIDDQSKLIRIYHLGHRREVYR